MGVHAGATAGARIRNHVDRDGFPSVARTSAAIGLFGVLSTMSRRLIATLATAAAMACTTKVVEPAAPPSQPPPTVAAPVAEPHDELGPRVERLAQRLEEARERYHVPGMAVAVVKDDGVVFARGFGVADLEAGTKVDARTLFPIGSSTKAFTATLTAMLVADGKLGWDDPIEQHVPELVLAVRTDDKAAKATIRDALSHRTGFTRMGILSGSGQVPRNEFLAQASKAKPLAKLRERFLYNNEMYTAVGEATARVADTTWNELLQKRITQPLGMKATIVAKEDVAKAKNLAKGYRWLDDKGHFEPLPFRALDEIAPAGAITSNVLDMTRWLRFQIGGGRFEGKRLVRADALQETWNQQIPVAGQVGYGMGWFLDSWNGKRMLHHGGNVDGYAAMVAMIPDERIGFVMLTNVSWTPLQDAVRDIVFDTMLAELDPDVPAEDVTPWVGSYIADFGPFAGAEFEVTSKGGKLFVDVPGQTNYELAPPGADGRRPFRATDQIAVSFEKGEGGGGKAIVMRLHQGGIDFELLRKGYVPPPEVPLRELARYEGWFDNPKLGRARVLIRNNRLAVDIPKQMVYELRPPDADRRWRFRVKNDIAITFAPDRGKATTMQLHQSGTTLKFKRVKGGKGLPDVDVLLAKQGGAKTAKALAQLGIVHARGTINAAGSGIDGTFDLYVAADGRTSMKVDFGKYGRSLTMVNRDGGWEHSSFGPDETLDGKLLQQAQLLHPFALVGDWRRTFDNVRVTGMARVLDRDAVVITANRAELPKHEIKVDAKSGELLEESFAMLFRGPGSIPTTRKYGDWRAVLGMRLPFRVVMESEPQGDVIMQIQSVKKFEGEPAAAFPPSPPTD
jgi:CubicO group peptidase (beta-lactamase class C family)